MKKELKEMLGYLVKFESQTLVEAEVAFRKDYIGSDEEFKEHFLNSLDGALQDLAFAKILIDDTIEVLSKVEDK